MNQERGQWTGRMGFILAAAGSAVGLGNLWKFPYISYANGLNEAGEPASAGAFVLVYIAAVIIIGAPIMAAEVILGRRSQLNPVGAFRSLAADKPGKKIWPGVGVLGVITGFVILSYYTVIAGWTIRYIIMALTGQLSEMTAAGPAAVETWLGEFVSSGGQQSLYFTLFMAATIGVVYFGVKNGIERAAKILMPILFAILVALAIYSTTTSGFGRAIAFLFKPDFSTLTRGAILEAVGHSFFTLSVGMGAMLTYGSYMRRQDSIPKAVFTISALDTVIALFACVIMFSIIFSFDFQVTKSAGILFTTIPVVLHQLPGGSVISAIFYLLVAFAALTSTISLMEVISSFAIDELKWTRRRSVMTMGIIVYVFGFLSAMSRGASKRLSEFNLIGRDTTEGFSNTLDYLASNWFLPVGGLLIALFVAWFLGRNECREELEQGHGEMKTYSGWRFLIRFAAPIAVGAIIISVILGAEYQ